MNCFAFPTELADYEQNTQETDHTKFQDSFWLKREKLYNKKKMIQLEKLKKCVQI